MAMLANRVWAWVHRGTSSDRRTGFVEMSDAEARNAIVGGRAQDPMVGAALLKHIDYTIPEPPGPPPPEDGEGEAAAAAPRRSSKSNGGGTALRAATSTKARA